MFFKKDKIVHCYCFITIRNDWRITDELINHINSNLVFEKIKLNYYIGLDDKYKEYKGNYKDTFKVDLKRLISFYTFNNKDSNSSELLIALSKGEFNFIYFQLIEEFGDQFLSSFNLINTFFKPDYGFSYKSILGKSPISYLMGNNSIVKFIVDIKNSNIKEGDVWIRNKLEVKKGFVRNVYKDNLLNKNQVNALCDSGLSLMDEIRSNEMYGEIGEIGEDLYYWKIDDENLNFTRNRFVKEKFVISSLSR